MQVFVLNLEILNKMIYREFGIEEKDISIFSGSSSELSSNFVLKSKTLSRFRLFSIDGGHTRDLTYNDLFIAAKNIVDGKYIYYRFLVDLHYR